MTVKKGDKIRILRDFLSSADVLKGDVLKVVGDVTSTLFITESPRKPAARGWWFHVGQQGDGWEIVQEGDGS